MSDNNFIPNSFQTPNAYVDKFLHLLTGEEWKALSYTARRIFGFQKRQDNISLAQFERGKRNRYGSQLDYGTGLSRPAIRRALDGLIKYNLMEEVAPNDPSRNEGACYALQLDSSKVDTEGLEQRTQEAAARHAKQTSHARQTRSVEQTPPISPTDPLPRQSNLLPPISPTDQYPVSPTYYPPLVEQTPPYSITENQRESQKENQKKHTHTESAPLSTAAQREAKAGVGVDSKFSLKQRLEWARHRAAQSGSTIRDPDAVALARADGQADELLEEYFNRTPEQAAEKARAPESSSMTFFEAAQIVSSMVQCGRTAQAALDSLPDNVSEDVRRKLLTKFGQEKQTNEDLCGCDCHECARGSHCGQGNHCRETGAPEGCFVEVR